MCESKCFKRRGYKARGSRGVRLALCFVQNVSVAQTRKEENVGSTGSQIILLLPVRFSQLFRL